MKYSQNRLMLGSERWQDFQHHMYREIYYQHHIIDLGNLNCSTGLDRLGQIWRKMLADTLM